MTDRRSFIRQITAAGAACSMPSMLFSGQHSGRKMIWADMLRLSYNANEDYIPEQFRNINYDCTTCKDAWDWAHGYRPVLKFDEATWDNLLQYLAESGINMVVLFLGDGILYQSHPEIAVKNAWTPEKLRSELAKMRSLGIEPIPKLNFSATHDVWLGPYSRMISSDVYYAVCRDLIGEICELFDYPRFFHIGMDEETASHQRNMAYCVIRQDDLWWGDFYYLTGEVEKNGVRPWIWSDYAWNHPDLFFRKMPRSVMQSNWYYGTRFDWKESDKKGENPASWKTYVRLYDDLEKYGYDQIPTGSNHSSDKNFEMTVEYCQNVINSSRLAGYMTAPWRPVMPQCLDHHKQAADQVRMAIRKTG
jgi:hypothetical protein